MSYYVNPHGHSSPWFPYAEQFGAPNINWCEAHLGTWIDQPANTYSNASYLVVALVLVWFAHRSRQKELMVFPFLVFGLGLASTIYHMSNNYLTQLMDFIGMFAVVFWIIALNFRRLSILPKEHYLPLTLGGITIFTLLVQLLYMLHIKYQFLVFFLVLIILGQEYLFAKNKPEGTGYRYLWTGLGLMIVAATFSVLDITGVMCDPNNHVLQGHAIWHVASSLSLGSIFFHLYQFDYAHGGLAVYESASDEDSEFDEATDPNIAIGGIELDPAMATSAPQEFRPKKPKERKNLYDEDIESQLEP